MGNRILLISDQKTKLFNQEADAEDFINTTSKPPHIIADAFDVLSKKNKLDAVFINAEAKVNGSNRSDLKGIELIFWLRLKCEYTGPIVTYGFLSAEQVLCLYPKYVVIHAPGNFYWRLGDIIDKDYLIYKENEKKNYIEFLKPFIDLSAIRHNSANYYSLMRLRKFHNAITLESFEINEQKPSTQELVYKSLFEGDLKMAMAKDAEKGLYEVIEDLEARKAEVVENLKPRGNKGERMGRPLDMLIMDKKTLDEYTRYDDGYELLSNRLKENEKIVEGWNKELISIDNQIKEKYKLKKDLKRKVIVKERENQLSEKIKTLRSLKGRIALIDDMAQEGWESFYSSLLGSNFEVVSFCPISDFKKFDAKTLAKEVLNINPHLILLDLRLYNKENTKGYPSGIKILMELRKINSITPMIVCSASNRGTNINTVLSKGANYYWLKEGIDLNNSLDLGVKNYERLIDLLIHLLDGYQVKIQDLYNTFSDKVDSADKFWWEQKDWKFEYNAKALIGESYLNLIPKITKIVNPYIIIDTVQTVLIRFSKLLISREGKSDSSDWKENSEFVLRLGRLIELIHRFDIIEKQNRTIKKQHKVYGKNYYNRNVNVKILSDTKKGKNGRVQVGRNDIIGHKLFKLRNHSAHYEGAKMFSTETTIAYIQGFVDYLIQDNEAINDVTIYEQNRSCFYDIDLKNPI